jgi:hypothetical protein
VKKQFGRRRFHIGLHVLTFFSSSYTSTSVDALLLPASLDARNPRPPKRKVSPLASLTPRINIDCCVAFFSLSLSLSLSLVCYLLPNVFPSLFPSYPHRERGRRREIKRMREGKIHSGRPARICCRCCYRKTLVLNEQ